MPFRRRGAPDPRPCSDAPRAVRSANEAALLSDDDQAKVAEFSPAFVYPIFGQEETIFGYRDLEIHVESSSRRPSRTRVG